MRLRFFLVNLAFFPKPKSLISAMISLNRGDATTLLSIKIRSFFAPYSFSIPFTIFVIESVSQKSPSNLGTPQKLHFLTQPREA